MIPLDLMDPTNNFFFENVTVFGIPMIFTTFRVDRNTVPKGLYAYDIMHDSEDGITPVKLAPFILVNHLGTVISKKQVQFPSSSNPLGPCLYFKKEDDWGGFEYETSLEEYMEDKIGDPGDN